MKGPAGNVNIASVGLLHIACLNAVRACLNGKCSAGDFHTVLSVQAASVSRCDGIGAACDDQIVLGYNRVLIFGVDRQLAASVQRQIRPAEDDTVHIAVLIRKMVGAAAAQRVIRAIRQREEDLIRLLYKQGCVVGAVDGRVLEYDAYLVRVRRLDDDPAVV